MPDDLLQHVFGPEPYLSGWLVWAVLLSLVVIGWYTGVFLWTLPSQRLRRIPGVRRTHGWLIRHRFARRVRRIADQHAAGQSSATAASAGISRTVRSFLYQATGVPAQYLQIGAMADGDLAAAAPLLTRLGDAQFNAEAHVDVAELSAQAQELIRSWS